MLARCWVNRSNLRQCSQGIRYTAQASENAGEAFGIPLTGCRWRAIVQRGVLSGRIGNRGNRQPYRRSSAVAVFFKKWLKALRDSVRFEGCIGDDGILWRALAGVILRCISLTPAGEGPGVKENGIEYAKATDD